MAYTALLFMVRINIKYTTWTAQLFMQLRIQWEDNISFFLAVGTDSVKSGFCSDRKINTFHRPLTFVSSLQHFLN